MVTGILANATCYADVKTGLYHFYDVLTEVTWDGSANVLRGKQLNSVDVVNNNLSVNFWLNDYSFQQNQTLVAPTCDTETYTGTVLLLGDASDFNSGGTGGTVEYDFTLASGFFGFAFVFVLSVWLVSKNIGVIMNAIRRF